MDFIDKFRQWAVVNLRAKQVSIHASLGGMKNHLLPAHFLNLPQFTDERQAANIFSSMTI